MWAREAGGASFNREVGRLNIENSELAVMGYSHVTVTAWLAKQNSQLPFTRLSSPEQSNSVPATRRFVHHPFNETRFESRFHVVMPLQPPAPLFHHPSRFLHLNFFTGLLFVGLAAKIGLVWPLMQSQRFCIMSACSTKDLSMALTLLDACIVHGFHPGGRGSTAAVAGDGGGGGGMGQVGVLMG